MNGGKLLEALPMLPGCARQMETLSNRSAAKTGKMEAANCSNRKSSPRTRKRAGGAKKENACEIANGFYDSEVDCNASHVRNVPWQWKFAILILLLKELR